MSLIQDCVRNAAKNRQYHQQQPQQQQSQTQQSQAIQHQTQPIPQQNIVQPIISQVRGPQQTRNSSIQVQSQSMAQQIIDHDENLSEKEVYPGNDKK